MYNSSGAFTARNHGFTNHQAASPRIDRDRANRPSVVHSSNNGSGVTASNVGAASNGVNALMGSGNGNAAHGMTLNGALGFKATAGLPLLNLAKARGSVNDAAALASTARTHNGAKRSVIQQPTGYMGYPGHTGTAVNGTQNVTSGSATARVIGNAGTSTNNSPQIKPRASMFGPSAKQSAGASQGTHQQQQQQQQQHQSHAMAPPSARRRPAAGPNAGQHDQAALQVPAHGAAGIPHSASSLSAHILASAAQSSHSTAPTATAEGVPLPMTPAVALKHYYQILTPFEQSEILEYQHVYFVGKAAAEKIKGIPHSPCNNGYDDERGDYHIVIHDHIGFRYEVLAILGKGSFGQVVKVLDHKTGNISALKLIRNKKRFHHQALVEVKLLEHLLDKDKDGQHNIVRMLSSFYHRNHLCITFELLHINLYELIKANNFVGLKLTLIRKFAVQMLQSLHLLRKERIIHCDLKPENVLLSGPNRTQIKLIDFGSSCYDTECVYTYIQSRFYRSPEVILGQAYGMEIDMWSFGCILAELYTGYPLFPGENETEQMQCMMEILGVPSKKFIDASSRKHKFFDENGNARLVPNSRGRLRRPGTKDLGSSTKSSDPQFISFLRQCLRWEPAQRLTPAKALEHPWITESAEQNALTSPPTPSVPYSPSPQPYHQQSQQQQQQYGLVQSSSTHSMNQSAQTAARGAPVAANGKGGSHLKHNAASTHHHTGSYQQQQQQLQRQQQQFDDGVQEDITGALNDAQAGLNYPSQCVEDLSAVQAELAADGEAEDEDDHQQRNLAKLQDRSGTQSRLGTADVPDSDDEQDLPEDLTQDPEVTVTVTGRGFGPQYGSNVADSKYDHKSHDISQKQQSRVPAMQTAKPNTGKSYVFAPPVPGVNMNYGAHIGDSAFGQQTVYRVRS